MGLSKLITAIFRPCTSAPKSPDQPASADIPEPKKIVVNPVPNVADPNAEEAAGESSAQVGAVNQDKQPKAWRSDDAMNEAHASSIEDKTEAFKASQEKEASSPKASSPKASPKKSPKKSKKQGGEEVPTEEKPKEAKEQEQEQEEGSGGGGGPDTKLILQVFGFDVLHQLQGKVWDERAQAVQAVRARLAQNDVGDASFEDFFRAACSVAQMSLTDKVMPVYLDGLELAKLLLGEFAKSNELLQELAREGVHTLVPIIVAKTSDRNARSIEGTQAALVALAKEPLVGCQPVMTHMLMPIASAKEIAAIRGRLELIQQFISEFGFSKSSGMSLSAVMTFVRPHLDAADEKVRRAAVEVTVQCYQLKGERTRKFCTNLMPTLQKLLEQRFAEADGVKSGVTKPKARSNLPELKGTRSRKSGLPGRPQAAVSRGSSRNSSSAGSIGSIGKHIGMPIERSNSRESNLSSSSKRAPKQLVVQEQLISADPFGPDPDGEDTQQNPNFIPSPTAQQGNDLFSTDEETFMREIESF
jgi:hypothetical protein